ncbi:lamin tail domain-containing protein [Streptomyces sp. NPDC059597]|uniref:lamin tail domain-containing protein n=1 Tax=Streptomyces sp. NPDC059597 TaxID=3346879 RepID=UPI0036B825FF
MSSRSISRIAAASLATGAALGAAALPASAQTTHHQAAPYRSGVVISDVQYDSPGFDNGSNYSLNREWIDITNTSRRSVNLSGWTLSSEDGHTYTFRHYRLGGSSTVRVHTGIGRDTYRDVYQDRRDYVWDNDSDTATLRNDRGRFVDDASWGGRRHHGWGGWHLGDLLGHHDRGHDGSHHGGLGGGPRGGSQGGHGNHQGHTGQGGGQHHGGRNGQGGNPGQNSHGGQSGQGGSQGQSGQTGQGGSQGQNGQNGQTGQGGSQGQNGPSGQNGQGQNGQGQGGQTGGQHQGDHGHH